MEVCDSHLHLDYLLQNEKFGGIGWSLKQHMCRYFMSDEGCPYESCDYAHGEAELVARIGLAEEDLVSFSKRHRFPGSDTAEPWWPILRCFVTNCCEREAIEDSLFLMSVNDRLFGGALYCTFGCHPSNYREYDDGFEAAMLKAMAAVGPRAVAWGECGLDYCKNYWDSEEPKERSRMLEVFVRQVKLAVSRGLPLVVHSRDADEDCMAVLREHLPREHKVHIHAFQGSVGFMKEALRAFPNCYFGASGMIIMPFPVEEALEIAKECPLERLLLETDSPYLAWGPRDITAIAKKVARFKGVTRDEVLAAAAANCIYFYGIEAVEAKLGPPKPPVADLQSLVDQSLGA